MTVYWIVARIAPVYVLSICEACEPTITRMVRTELIVGFIALALCIFAVVDCISIYESRIKTLNKLAWVFIIILLPIIGPVLWLTLGKGHLDAAQSPARFRDSRRVAPDDDPVFLRNASRMEEQDERIRRLEAELKALNDDKPEE
jgi:multisubunit Na+/H+ antiporter MnhG subunit